MMKTLYKISFISPEEDVGSVLRPLMTLVKSVSVIAPKGHDGSRASRYAIVATFAKLPTLEQIAAIRQSGATVSDQTMASLEAAWRGSRSDEETDIELLLNAGDVKRSVLQRIRRPEG